MNPRRSSAKKKEKRAAKGTNVFYIDEAGVRKEFTEAQLKMIDEHAGTPKVEKKGKVVVRQVPDSFVVFELHGKPVTLREIKRWAEEDMLTFLREAEGKEEALNYQFERVLHHFDELPVGFQKRIIDELKRRRKGMK